MHGQAASPDDFSYKHCADSMARFQKHHVAPASPKTMACIEGNPDAIPQRLWKKHLRGSGAHHGARAFPAAASSPTGAVLLVGLAGGPWQGLRMPLGVLPIGQVMALASGYAGQPTHGFTHPLLL